MVPVVPGVPDDGQQQDQQEALEQQECEANAMCIIFVLGILMMIPCIRDLLHFLRLIQ